MRFTESQLEANRILTETLKLPAVKADWMLYKTMTDACNYVLGYRTSK